MTNKDLSENINISEGCYYYLNDDNCILRVIKYYNDKVDVVNSNLETFSICSDRLIGIQLEEWIISKTRFKEINNYQWSYTYEKAGVSMVLILTTHTTFMTINPCDPEINHLQYLHELQNVFTNITGRRLELDFKN